VKIEYKIILGLIGALLLCVIYITYVLGGHIDTSTTIADLREYNNLARETIDGDRELQEQYNELQLTADRLIREREENIRERESLTAERDSLKRERDEALDRIGKLVGVTEEIGTAMGESLNEAFRIIDQGREDIRQAGE